MKWILSKFELFKESKSYSNKNIINEICISMVLLNNEFLDKILDKGISGRYTENSTMFLTDLKNILLSNNNRLKLGKISDNKFVEDEEISKVNGLFDNVDFDIEKNWKDLINSRTSARTIIDKIIPDEKLDPEKIKNIYWIGPNKDGDIEEDIVIEMKDSKQYSIVLNKKLSSSKTQSFNKFAEDLIGNDLEMLFKENYLPRWNRLTKEWIRIIYENANKNIQKHISKFISHKSIDSIGYFDYFSIRHSDPKFKHLGEYMEEFDKNILKLSDLLSEVWKDRESFFMDPERVNKEWCELKIAILNSKILENLFTTSIRSNYTDSIKKLSDGYKLATGNIKMKFFKILVDKMGCIERTLYYVSKNGDEFNLIPARDFFREYYDDLDIKFDYHVNFVFNKSDEEENDFKVKIKLDIDNENLLNTSTTIKFSGGEMSGKLNARHNIDISPRFNYLISKKLKSI